MELGPRDRLSQAFWHEEKKGRTVNTKWGPCVNLDMRHLGEKLINERLPFVRDLAKSYLGIDMVDAPVPVRPVVHYMMGGIHTDINAATPVPGLYSAGECACGTINGANRLGSNSLTELLVFGAMAGRQAVDYAKNGAKDVKDKAILDLANAAKSRITGLFERSQGKESIAGLRSEMHDTMESGAGIYRTEDSLQATVTKIGELRTRFTDLALTDKSSVFNTELIQALELDAMIETAHALAHCALVRTESRGSHQRLDHPKRDDKTFLKHSMAYFNANGDPRIEYLDVVITKSQPAERLYGGAGEKQSAAPAAE